MSVGDKFWSTVHNAWVRVVKVEGDGMVQVADSSGKPLPDLVNHRQLLRAPAMSEAPLGPRAADSRDALRKFSETAKMADHSKAKAIADQLAGMSRSNKLRRIAGVVVNYLPDEDRFQLEGKGDRFTREEALDYLQSYGHAEGGPSPPQLATPAKPMADRFPAAKTTELGDQAIAALRRIADSMPKGTQSNDRKLMHALIDEADKWRQKATAAGDQSALSRIGSFTRAHA